MTNRAFQDRQDQDDQSDRDSGDSDGTKATRVFPYHSWVAECEAAGVYSRDEPRYDYAGQPGITLSLTLAEVKNLAQRHLNTVYDWKEYFAWNGLPEGRIEFRVVIHESRFRQLYELLAATEREQFDRQIEIRDRYIHAIEGEVEQCEAEEAEFWRRVEAGLVSESERAAHKTPPFIAGLPVMPPPADGEPSPEKWDAFAGEL